MQSNLRPSLWKCLEASITDMLRTHSRSLTSFLQIESTATVEPPIVDTLDKLQFPLPIVIVHYVTSEKRTTSLQGTKGGST